MSTIIHYGLKGDKRKQLAVQISLFLEKPSIYLGVPTYAYKIGDYLVDKNGTLTCPDSEDTQVLIAKLTEAGYVGELEAPNASEEVNTVQNETSEVSPIEELPSEECPESAAQTPDTPLKTENSLVDTTSKENATVAQENGNLEISIPRESMPDETLDRLKKLIDNNSNLFKHAFMVNNLGFVITEEKIIFPWFSYTEDADQIKAYMQFIDALCLAAREAKSIRTKEEAPDDNEKFTMRLFLVTRLHMIGDDYKTTRKLLLKNLTGNSSWRNGKPDKGDKTNE